MFVITALEVPQIRLQMDGQHSALLDRDHRCRTIQLDCRRLQHRCLDGCSGSARRAANAAASAFPRLELTLTVTRDPDGDGRDALVLILEAVNTGNVTVDVGAVRWSASVLGPADDSVVVMRQEYDQRAERHSRVEFPWHVAFLETVAHDLPVNPVRTERIVCARRMDSRIHALVASAYVYNGPNRFNAPGGSLVRPLWMPT